MAHSFPILGNNSWIHIHHIVRFFLYIYIIFLNIEMTHKIINILKCKPTLFEFGPVQLLKYVHTSHTHLHCSLWVCEPVVHCGCVGVLSASPVNRAHRDADYRGISSAVQPRRQRTQKLFLCLSRFPLFCLPFLLFFFPSAHYSWRSHCIYIKKMSPINTYISLLMYIMVYGQSYICDQYWKDS